MEIVSVEEARKVSQKNYEERVKEESAILSNGIDSAIREAMDKGEFSIEYNVMDYDYKAIYEIAGNLRRLGYEIRYDDIERALLVDWKIAEKKT